MEQLEKTRVSKIHAIRFRCHLCHYAYNEKYPDFWSEAVGPGLVAMHVDVTCPRCRKVHTINLVQRERR